MKRILIILGLCGVLFGQQKIPLQPSSLAYYSYSPVPQDAAPLGTEFLVSFPNQAAGSQLTIPACSTYSALKYNHFTYDAGSATWSGPVTGPVYGFFTKFGSSANPVSSTNGLEVNVSFAGQLGSNTNSATQTFVQSVYYSTDNCFEYGPEFGFYRLLQHPGNSTELSTVYFYYGLNVNCFNVSALGSCRDKVSGQSLQYNVVTQPLTVPAQNSKGGTNFIYRAYVPKGVNQFLVAVFDPYTLISVASASPSIDPAGFFAPTAQQMWSTGLSGYMTYTQQRNSIQGGITDNMNAPLKLTVYTLAQLVVAAVIPTAQAAGVVPATGWCMQGNQGIYASVTAGAAPTQRKLQQSYAGCSVTVYNGGTTNPATIYSNNGGPPTPLTNPFHSNANGFYQFYAANGVYDVVLSGGGLSAPLSVGSMELFDYSTWSPTSFVANSVCVNGGSATFVQCLTSGTLTQSTTWVLPPTDLAGCLESNGSGQLFFTSCSLNAGSDTEILYNKGGTAFGDANFLWDYTNQVMTVTGKVGTAALNVNTGYINTTGGLFTNVGNWQAINTNVDGALLRGLNVGVSTASNTGGYINLAVLGYGNHPAPLTGLSGFGTHTGLLWVSGFNDMAGDTTTALNTNLYINAAGGLAVCTLSGGVCADSNFNSIQSPSGGLFGQSVTAVRYVQVGHAAADPAVTTGDTFHNGALYFSDASNCLKVYQGTGFSCVSSGSGGSPGGANTNVQYNNAGSFGGSTNFYWNNGTQQAVVTATGANAAGMVNLVGFVQAENGFLAQNVASPSTALNYNVIQTPQGGMAAKSFTATGYIQSGHNTVVPTLTTSDAFHAGAMYYDDVNTCEKVYSGTTWACIGSGGVTPPGGANTNVQFNNSGAFGGASTFVWNNTSHVLSITGTTAGLTVGTNSSAGVVQAFGAASNTAVFQVIQEPSGTFPFQVDGLGDVSGAGQGAFGLASFTGVAGVFANNSASNSTVTITQHSSAPALTVVGGVTLSSISGSTQCLNVNSTGVVTGTGTACAAGGVPGGANTNVQFNNSGAFGGSANFAWNNGSNVLTVAGTGAGITAGTISSPAAIQAYGAANTAAVFQVIQEPAGTFPFQVDGLGDISGAGSLNLTGGSSAYKMGGTTIVDVNKNASFTSLTSISGTPAAGIFLNTSATTQTASIVNIGSAGALTVSAVGGGSSIETIIGNVKIGSTSGLISAYNGLPTAGQGVPAIYSSIATGVISASQNLSLLVNGTSAPAGLYRVCGFGQYGSSGANTNHIAVTAVYEAPDTTGYNTTFPSTVGYNSFLNSVFDSTDGCLAIRSNGLTPGGLGASSAISVSVSFFGGSGGTYNGWFTLERIQ